MIPACTGAKWRTLERSSHKAVIRVEVAAAGDDTFDPMPVTGVQITLNEAGVLPGRECVVTTSDQAATAAAVNVLGGWLRIFTDATFWTGEHATLKVPWGYYRIDSVEKNRDGTVTIRGSDAGAAIVAHEALTLAEKTIPPGVSLHQKLRDLINPCWPDGVNEWSTVMLDTGAIPDHVTTALDVIDARRDGVVVAVAAKLGAVLIPTVDGSSMYRLARPVASITPVANISEGPGGNFVGGRVTYDRATITNQVHAVWTGEKVAAAGGGAGIEQQQRRIVSYTEPDSAAGIGGPLGIQSTEVTATDITDAATADSRALAAIQTTFAWNHQHTIDTSPIYGLEAGDVVTINGDKDMTVVGGLIDLSGAWQLQLSEQESLLSGMRRFTISHTHYEGAIADNTQWNDWPIPGTINTTFKNKSAPAGWSCAGGTLACVDGNLIVTCTAATVTVHVATAIPVPAPRRVRASINCGSSYTLVKKGKKKVQKKRGYRASLSILYAGNSFIGGQNFGAAEHPLDGPVVSSGNAVEARADVQLPPSPATGWGVSLRLTNVVSGQRVTINSLAAEWGAGR